MSAAALTREITEAGVGVGRLIRYDPRWADGFDPTARGFLRSFLGPLLGLPFYLVVATMFALSPGEGGSAATAAAAFDSATIWEAAVSHLMNAVAYPLIVAVLARPLGLGAGYAGFIVVVNWATLFLNMAAAAVSLMTLGGEVGYQLFGFAWLVLFGVSLFVTWRAARETLSPEIPPALLMVVLSVGVGVLTDRAAAWMFGTTPP